MKTAALLVIWNESTMKVVTIVSGLRIGTRIYAGFGVTLVLLAALGALGVVNLDGMQTSLSSYGQTSDLAMHVTALDSGFVEVRRNAFHFAITGSEQAKKSVRDGIAQLRDGIAKIGRLSQDTGRALTATGRAVDEYAVSFDRLVADIDTREKADAMLAKTGVAVAGEITSVVKLTSDSGEYEAAVAAGRVEQKLLVARIFAARFTARPEEALAQGFRDNYKDFLAALEQLTGTLKNGAHRAPAEKAASMSGAYAQAFEDYARMAMAIDASVNKTLAQQGRTIQRTMQEIVAAQRDSLDGLGRRMAVDMTDTRVTVITIAIGALMFGLLIAFLIARGIVKPVSGLTGGMKELADGNFDVVLPGLDRKDEVGDMARAVEAFKVKAADHARLEAEEHQAEEARRAAERRGIAEREAAEKAEAEARLATERKAAIHKLADAFESAVGGIVETVSQASNELEAAAGTLTTTAETTQHLSNSVAVASEQASANVQSVASSTEELAGSVDEISRQVAQSTMIANQAVKQAQATDARINALSHAATRIGDVVKLITAIAEQTNLLALNATIEAARAGEAGRGFAVVANEVKALAAQTAKATDEIAGHIAGMQNETTAAVTAIKEIGGTISHISEITATIAAAVEEQDAATSEIARNVSEAAKGTTQVAGTIGHVNQGAAETGTASSQVLASARQLAGESNRLKLEVDKFLATVRAA
jgi:methyl-accepting chemotaxis protein